MTDTNNSLLEYSKAILLPEGYIEEGLKDTVAEKAKKLEQKSREHLGDKTTEAIKDTAKKVSTSAAQSVRDALIQSAADKAGDAVLGIGRWAIRKITGKNKK